MGASSARLAIFRFTRRSPSSASGECGGTVDNNWDFLPKNVLFGSYWLRNKIQFGAQVNISIQIFLFRERNAARWQFMEWHSEKAAAMKSSPCFTNLQLSLFVAGLTRHSKISSTRWCRGSIAPRCRIGLSSTPAILRPSQAIPRMPERSLTAYSFHRRMISPCRLNISITSSKSSDNI